MKTTQWENNIVQPYIIHVGILWKVSFLWDWQNSKLVSFFMRRIYVDDNTASLLYIALNGAVFALSGLPASRPDSCNFQKCNESISQPLKNLVTIIQSVDLEEDKRVFALYCVILICPTRKWPVHLKHWVLMLQTSVYTVLTQTSPNSLYVVVSCFRWSNTQEQWDLLWQFTGGLLSNRILNLCKCTHMIESA